MKVRLAFFEAPEQEADLAAAFSEERELGFLWLAEPIVPRCGERVHVHEYVKRLLVEGVLEGELPPETEYEVKYVTYLLAADGELRASVFCCRIA